MHGIRTARAWCDCLGKLVFACLNDIHSNSQQLVSSPASFARDIRPSLVQPLFSHGFSTCIGRDAARRNMHPQQSNPVDDFIGCQCINNSDVCPGTSIAQSFWRCSYDYHPFRSFSCIRMAHQTLLHCWAGVGRSSPPNPIILGIKVPVQIARHPNPCTSTSWIGSPSIENLRK